MVRALPVRDSSGKIFEWAGTSTDVHGMRMSQARYRLLADSMPQIVATSDADGVFNYFNRWFYDYTGLPSFTAGAGTWSEVVHPADLPRVGRRWSAAVRAGRAFETDAGCAATMAHTAGTSAGRCPSTTTGRGR